jgi:hypothetical protein
MLSKVIDWLDRLFPDPDEDADATGAGIPQLPRRGWLWRVFP